MNILSNQPSQQTPGNGEPIFHFPQLSDEHNRLIRFTFDYAENDTARCEAIYNQFGDDMYLFREVSDSGKIHYHGCINLKGRRLTNRSYQNQLKKICDECNFAFVTFKQPSTYHRQQTNKQLNITIQDFAYIYDSKDHNPVGAPTGIWSDIQFCGLYEKLNVYYAATYKHNKSTQKVPFLTQLTRDYKISESYNNYCSNKMQQRMLYGQERADIFDSIMRYVWNYNSSYNKVNDVKKFDKHLLISFSWTIYNCYYDSKELDFESLNPFSNQT